MSALLEVRDLHVDFGRHRSTAVEASTFSLDAGERLGLIGESGSGKSVTALAIMGLLPGNAHVSGSVLWRGRNLIGLPDAHLAGLRGSELAMIFQEPMTALDPTMRVGRQVAEVLRLHEGASAGSARERVIAMLAEVGVEAPERVADAFPHELSGGQRQRALIAMALINQPDLVLCDEPTTALDVTVQARVLRLLDEQLDAVQAACLFISHDLAVVSQVCDTVMVMRHGRIIERGSVAQILTDAQHPYTRALVAASRLDLAEPGSLLPVLEEGL